MTPEDAFLEDIREHPEDDAPRLIFADWLEDNGDSDRGEFIRLQCRIARLDRGAPAARELRDRAGHLLQTNWKRWTEPLGKLLPEWPTHQNWPRIGYRPDALSRFSRGFVESLDLDTGHFVNIAAEVFRLYPIRHLDLHQAGDHATRLAECSPLEWVESLVFSDYYRAPLDARGMTALAGSRQLRRLWYLGLYRNHLGDVGAGALASAGWLANLRWVVLDDNGLSERGIAALARTHRQFRPHRLQLNANPIGDDGVFILAQSPILSDVRRLALANCRLGVEAVTALANSPHLYALEELDLSNNSLTHGSKEILNAAPWRGRLRLLQV